jgi:hypothetical protein
MLVSATASARVVAVNGSHPGSVATVKIGEISETQAEPVRNSAEARKQTLFNAVQSELRAGWQVESRSDYHATLAKAKNHSHGLHLFLSIITFGLWALFVWLPLSVFGGLKRKMLGINGYGSVSVRKV